MQRLGLLAICLFLAIGTLISAKDASAITLPPGSVSLEDVVVKSDLIVVGTITDNRCEVVTVGEGESAGKHVYTIFTLSVEKVIKGDPDTKEVLIRVEGGVIGDTGLWVEDQYYFLVSDGVLLCLDEKGNNIFGLRFGGMLWIEGKATRVDVSLREVICRVAEIMRKNDIPIALPPEEISDCPEKEVLPESPPAEKALPAVPPEQEISPESTPTENDLPITPPTEEKPSSPITAQWWIAIVALAVSVGVITALVVGRYYHRRHSKIN